VHDSWLEKDDRQKKRVINTDESLSCVFRLLDATKLSRDQFYSRVQRRKFWKIKQRLLNFSMLPPFGCRRPTSTTVQACKKIPTQKSVKNFSVPKTGQRWS